VTALWVLWDTSLVLMAAALLSLLILLVARAFGGRRARKHERVRQQVTRALLSGDLVLASAGSRLDRQIAAEVTIELAELVRGSDRERFLHNAQALGVADVLRRALRAGSAQERLTAAEALAMFPGETAREVLAALDDRNPDVRLGAALALAQNHRAPPAAELVRKLGLGTRERSRLAVSLMRDLVETDPQGVEAMLYDETLPDEAKLAATDALAASGMVESAPLVAWMAGAAKHQTELQPRIYRALGRIGHPGGRDAVLEGLRSPEWQVRSAAAEAAGKIGLTDAIAPLRDLLGDDHWWTRFRSGEALSRLGRAGRNALIQEAQSGSPLAQHAATATLTERSLS
jgi:HEAT repeat protein